MAELELTLNEQKKLSLFKEKHAECVAKRPMSTDGKHAFSFIVTPGGVGTNTTVVCNECGKKEDITDYDSF